MKQLLLILKFTLPIICACGQTSPKNRLLERSEQKQEQANTILNKSLAKTLDSIYIQDQKYRLQMDEIGERYGWESDEMKEIWKITDKQDASNLIKVEAILDKYGWLGADAVGEQGNSTLFLVIQHANQATREKYLPMMREAVKKGKAQISSLALLEDRVALERGKRQIYGSQVKRDSKTQLYYVSPLEDPENVDKRRATVGLEPIAEYVKHWQIKWDVKQYKRDLIKIEGKSKKSERF